jgi:hypothetical protein
MGPATERDTDGHEQAGGDERARHPDQGGREATTRLGFGQQTAEDHQVDQAGDDADDRAGAGTKSGRFAADEAPDQERGDQADDGQPARTGDERQVEHVADGPHGDGDRERECRDGRAGRGGTPEGRYINVVGSIESSDVAVHASTIGGTADGEAAMRGVFAAAGGGLSLGPTLPSIGSPDDGGPGGPQRTPSLVPICMTRGSVPT